MTLSDLEVMLIQRQITWKWYNIQLYTYNGRPIESRIWSIKRRHFQWPWTTPTSTFRVMPFFDAKYLRNGTRYRYSVIYLLLLPFGEQRCIYWNNNRNLHTPYRPYAIIVSFRMALSDFNDLAKYSMSGSVARSHVPHLSLLLVCNVVEPYAET